MKIAFYGDSLTRGIPGISSFGMLETQLPEHELTNHGRNGDTVASLYRRIATNRFQDGIDIAVLWVGVNDVLAKVTLTHSLVKRLMKQPWATDLIEFRHDYDRTIQLLRQHAGTVLTVSPLLIGEDLRNPWNKDLAERCKIIASISACIEHVHWLDIRADFAERLKAKTISDYTPRSVMSIARDVLFLRTPAQIDAAAASRGLHLTLDGVHLNSEGAKLVTEAFQKTFRAFSASFEPSTRGRHSTDTPPIGHID